MTNYAGCYGDHRSWFKPNGVFESSPVNIASITDGTSETVAMSEFLVGIPDQVQRLRSIFAPSIYGGDPPATLDQFAARCRSLDRMEPASNLKGFPWTRGQREMTLYDNGLPINQPTCRNTAGSTEAAGASTATSLHPGGANVLFADGHVRFLNEGIAAPVWRALGTRAGGEVVSAIGY